MAIFKYLGDPRLKGKPCQCIRTKHKDGTVHDFFPQPPATEWNINDTFDCGTDERCLRMLRCDPRFEEVI